MSLAAALRSARLQAGWSERELARRSGVSQATISGIESGRDPGLGTFARLVRALPLLDVRAALGLRRSWAPPASARLWRFFARGFGVQSRRVTLEAQVDERGGVVPRLRVEGLSLRGAPRDAASRVALMAGVLAGSPELAWRLLEERDASGRPSAGSGRPVTIEAPDALHRFETDPGGATVTYERTHRGASVPSDEAAVDGAPRGRPYREGISIALDHATRELVLDARLPAGRRRAVRIECWPASLGVDAEHRIGRAHDLYPGLPPALAPGADGRVRVVLRSPPPALRWGLSWDDPVPPGRLESGVVGKPVRSRRPKDVLAAARRRAGLSRREMARRLGASPATVMASEAGREPRVSIVSAWLRELPDLSPWLLLGEREGEAGHDDAWAFLRDAFGLEVEQESRLFELTPEGGQEATLTTSGLTWAPEAAADLRLRLGSLRMPETGRRRLLSVLAGASSRPRIRVVRDASGAAVHELRFAAPRGGPGRVTYARRATVSSGQYAMTVERAREPAFAGPTQWRALRSGGAFAEALYVEPALPARKLVVVVAFPEGMTPIRPAAKALARGTFAFESLPDLRPAVHPSGFSFEVRRRGRVLQLVVERPLVGLRYALSWELG